MRSIISAIVCVFFGCALVRAQNLPLPELKYGYDALEPIIDETTMRTHHLKHHNGYTNKLNAAFEQLRAEGFKNMTKLGLDAVLRRIQDLPVNHRPAVRNNGGGYANHCLFFDNMTPPGKNAEHPEPTGRLGEAIARDFQSFGQFKALFEDTATKLFGSGWAWLYYDNRSRDLKIMSTPNQDTPAMMQWETFPLLALDVWEHAYYLKYKNDRPAYISSWWSVVDWAVVEQRFEAAMSKIEADLQSVKAAQAQAQQEKKAAPAAAAAAAADKAKTNEQAKATEKAAAPAAAAKGGAGEWDENGVVKHYSDASWEAWRARNEPAVVMFYAPWCGHCKRLKPAWAQASELLAKTQPGFQVAAVDCTQHKATCTKFNVRGYPTLHFFDGQDANGRIYNGPRSAEGIAEWVGRNMGKAKEEL